MKQIFLILSSIILFGTASCYNKPEYPDTPSLKFLSMNKNTMLQGFSAEDSIEIVLELTDGDGDIGFDDTDTLNKSIFITDLRTGNVSEQFRIPSIPENIVSNGILAELNLKLYTTCCLFPDNIPPCSKPIDFPFDTLIYEIYIIDRAGNISNSVRTDPIILTCN